MNKTISITSQDPILNSLNFRPYRSTMERRVQPFLPRPDEDQTLDLVTPWGDQLKAHPGDLLVSEIDHPEDQWPVREYVFSETYMITRPGYCVKKELIYLAQLVELTGGDENVEVIVYSLEGPTKVRAGDFFLARGTQGEIWVYPKQKAAELLVLVEE